MQGVNAASVSRTLMLTEPGKILCKPRSGCLYWCRFFDHMYEYRSQLRHGTFLLFTETLKPFIHLIQGVHD